ENAGSGREAGVDLGDGGGTDLSRGTAPRRLMDASGLLRLAILRSRAREATHVAARLEEARALRVDTRPPDRAADSSALTVLAAGRVREATAQDGRDGRGADPFRAGVLRAEEAGAGVIDRALGPELERVAIPRTRARPELQRHAAIRPGS